MSDKKMNPEVKAKWVEALRSGKYQQGYNYLNYDGKHCCLGVLCELAVEEGKIPTKHNGWSVGYGENDNTKLPPVAVVEWAGLPNRSPYIDVGVMDRGDLATLNDSGKYDFNKIADLIEENL